MRAKLYKLLIIKRLTMPNKNAYIHTLNAFVTLCVRFRTQFYLTKK